MRFPSYLSDLRDDFPYRYWVNLSSPALPVAPPHIRFLCVRLTVCYRLPSSGRYLPDSAESLGLPPIGRPVDFHHINTRALLGARGVCNFSCPGQVYRWGGAIRPSSFLRLGNPQSGQKGRSLSAIARVVKHSWNCARPKASADRPEQMPRKVLAQPERLPIACGLGDAKRSACSPPSHAAASAGVTGAEPLSRGWQSVQAFHLG